VDLCRTKKYKTRVIAIRLVTYLMSTSGSSIIHFACFSIFGNIFIPLPNNYHAKEVKTAGEWRMKTYP